MSNIYRGSFSNVWIKLQASEELGLLDSSYLEDYYGNDGQISLWRVATGEVFPIVMVEVVIDTPDLPHDVFQGVVALVDIPDGDYEVRGRCRDLTNNYTVLNSVLNPFGTERVASLSFSVLPGIGESFVMTGGMLLQSGFIANPLDRSPTSRVGGSLGRNI